MKKYTMERHEAIETIMNLIGDEILVSSNGMVTRELFSIKDRPQNFYMIGGMGLPSAVGLGLALSQPDKKIVVLAGDGNILMGLGSLTTIGNVAPKNLTHIVLDNECHESTGGQASSSNTTELHLVAKNSNFKKVGKVESRRDLEKSVREFLDSEGPSFLLVKVKKGRKESQRVNTSPEKIKERIKNCLL